jgi:N-acetylneuraminic acid mutarotase
MAVDSRHTKRQAAQRRRVVRRRRRALVVVLAVACGLVAWVSLRGSGTHPHSSTARVGQTSRLDSQGTPEHFAARRLPFTLPVALQDAAAVALGSGRLALFGGLSAADTSTAAVSVFDAQGVAASARLPEPQHDAQGALIDARAYTFGGGQFSSYNHILSYNPQTGSVAQVASLPTPTSDAGVAEIAGTAYVVGGYDGEQALDTIVAWRPGERPQVVARLPYGLRYAAVAASDGRLLIAGGSHDEAATTAVLSFDPATATVRHIGRLPDPITHATAVALGPYVYVLGGRGAAPGTQTAAIVAVNAATGRCARVGRLPQPLSDAAAALVNDRVWLAGGLSPNGPVASVLELRPVAP